MERLSYRQEAWSIMSISTNGKKLVIGASDLVLCPGTLTISL
jgi:hypothetical protein